MLRSVPFTVPFVAVPLEAPRLVRHCPRCGVDRPFASSGGFRVNAQKRRLDVWLVRRCAACDGTWNQPVHERVSPASLGERLARYQGDDPALVHAVAFDEAALRRFGRVVPAAFRVDRPAAEPPFAARIELPQPFGVRLDHLLCEGLGLSRSRLRTLVAAERIVVGAPLDRPAVHGTLAWIEGPGAAIEAA